MRVDKEMLHDTSDQWLFQNEVSIAGNEAIFHSTTLFAGYGQGIIIASLNILCIIVYIFISSIYFMHYCIYSI